MGFSNSAGWNGPSARISAIFAIRSASGCCQNPGCRRGDSRSALIPVILVDGCEVVRLRRIEPPAFAPRTCLHSTFMDEQLHEIGFYALAGAPQSPRELFGEIE